MDQIFGKLDSLNIKVLKLEFNQDSIDLTQLDDLYKKA